jgi:hypothetical protein
LAGGKIRQYLGHSLARDLTRRDHEAVVAAECDHFRLDPNYPAASYELSQPAR